MGRIKILVASGKSEYTHALDGIKVQSLANEVSIGKEGNMWIEYVRDGLKKGQQVFRRSVVESLLEEIDQQSNSRGDSAEVAALKRELSIVKKQYRDLNIRLHSVKAGSEAKEKDEHAAY